MQGKLTIVNTITIDRPQNFGQRIAGLEHDTHLKGEQFNIALARMFTRFLQTVISSHMQYCSIFCSVRVFKRMILGSVHQEASDSYLIIEIRASIPLFNIHSVCSHLCLHTSVQHNFEKDRSQSLDPTHSFLLGYLHDDDWLN